MNRPWWEWLLGALGAVMVVVLLIYGIGASLPESHTVSLSTRVDTSQEAVWALITDVRRFPEWRPGVQAVEVVNDEPAPLTWRETTDMGSLTFEAERWDPPRRMVARIADEGLPFGGAWTYEVVPAPEGGAILTITEDGEVYDPLFRFFSRFVFGQEGTIRSYLGAVETHFGDR